MKNRIKDRWKRGCICLLSAFFALCFTINTVYAAKVPTLYAQAYCVMEADSGRVLASKNLEQKRANASTTKILTALYVIEHCDLNGTVTVSKKAASQPKVHLQMVKGEKYKVKDLLYALMLESYNDCAYALAEYACGSVKKFEEAVNQEAKEIGATNTHFVTPNGLDKKDQLGWHHTTAKDLALIMRRCIKNKTFLQITQRRTYSFKNVSGTRSFTCNNHNLLLRMMKGAISGKTGYTDRAGYCYIGAVKKNGITYIVALLRSGVPKNYNYKWEDMSHIIAYAKKTYERKTVTTTSQDLGRVKVEDGTTTSIEPYVKETTFYTAGTKKEVVSTKCEYLKNLEAPIKKDQKIGTVSYYVGNQQIKTQDIYAKKAVKKQTIWWKIQHAVTSLFQ